MGQNSYQHAMASISAMTLPDAKSKTLDQLLNHITQCLGKPKTTSAPGDEEEEVRAGTKQSAFSSIEQNNIDVSALAAAVAETILKKHPSLEQLTSQRGNANANGKTGGGQSRVFCWICGEKGHKCNTCPEKKLSPNEKPGNGNRGRGSGDATSQDNKRNGHGRSHQKGKKPAKPDSDNSSDEEYANAAVVSPAKQEFTFTACDDSTFWDHWSIHPSSSPDEPPARAMCYNEDIVDDNSDTGGLAQPSDYFGLHDQDSCQQCSPEMECTPAMVATDPAYYNAVYETAYHAAATLSPVPPEQELDRLCRIATNLAKVLLPAAEWTPVNMKNGAIPVRDPAHFALTCSNTYSPLESLDEDDSNVAQLQPHPSRNLETNDSPIGNACRGWQKHNRSRGIAIGTSRRSHKTSAARRRARRRQRTNAVDAAPAPTMAWDLDHDQPSRRTDLLPPQKLASCGSSPAPASAALGGSNKPTAAAAKAPISSHPVDLTDIADDEFAAEPVLCSPLDFATPPADLLNSKKRNHVLLLCAGGTTSIVDNLVQQRVRIDLLPVCETDPAVLSVRLVGVKRVSNTLPPSRHCLG